MEKLFLTVNVGSASKKCGLYRGAQRVASAHFEREDGRRIVTFGGGEKRAIEDGDFTDAVEYFVSELVASDIVPSARNISAIGFRIVAPGSFFREHRLMDGAYIARLQRARAEDPLHLGAMLEEIDRIKRLFPKTPVVGASDSAFHASMPEYASSYALPSSARYGLDIKRFGYHGLSVSSVVRKLAAAGKLPECVVLCHLGSGSSIVALKSGRSVDASMGFSPLEGVPMATRIGDIDAGALIRLARSGAVHDLGALEEMLYSQCGLLGLSGTTADMRELIELEKNGDEAARLAIEALTYRIRKYIGAYAAALGGINLLVFSGTIGERSFIIRDRVCGDLGFLGLALSKKRNDALDGGKDGAVHAEHSRVPVLVACSDESAEIARAVAELLAR